MYTPQWAKKVIFVTRNLRRSVFDSKMNVLLDFEQQNEFYKKKKPAYGRQNISRPMRIVAPIPQ